MVGLRFLKESDIGPIVANKNTLSQLSSFLRNDYHLMHLQMVGRRFLSESDIGAPEGNNLEPFSAPELLAELENWTEVLKSEPEVIHRLAAFAEAAGDGVDLDDDLSFDVSAPEVSP